MDYSWISGSLPQQQPPTVSIYHVRIYEEKGKLRLQALKAPPANLTKYELRVCHIYKGFRGDRETIKFYLDNVWIQSSLIPKIATKISNGIDKGEAEKFKDVDLTSQSSPTMMRIHPTYHVRVYQENNRLKFEALKRPLFASGGRTYMLVKNENARKIVFYLDDVWVDYETTFKIAQQIYDKLGW
jgi:hypothetical protein